MSGEEDFSGFYLSSLCWGSQVFYLRKMQHCYIYYIVFVSFKENQHLYFQVLDKFSLFLIAQYIQFCMVHLKHIYLEVCPTNGAILYCTSEIAV